MGQEGTKPMRTYIESIKVTREIAGNTLTLTFTSGTHVHVTVANFAGNGGNRFTLKDGKSYYCTGHVWRKDDGTWGYRESNDFHCPDTPSTSHSPRSAYGFIRQAFLDAVTSVVNSSDGAEILRRAELRDVNDGIRRAEEKRAELVKQLAEVDAELASLLSHENATKADASPTYASLPVGL